jgi:hypothetical protein
MQQGKGFQPSGGIKNNFWHAGWLHRWIKTENKFQSMQNKITFTTEATKSETLSYYWKRATQAMMAVAILRLEI